MRTEEELTAMIDEKQREWQNVDSERAMLDSYLRTLRAEIIKLEEELEDVLDSKVKEPYDASGDIE